MEQYQKAWEGPFFEESKNNDYLAIQLYTRMVVGPEELCEVRSEGPIPPELACYPKGTRIMRHYGLEFKPSCVGAAIRYAFNKTKLPIMITENGLAGDVDEERIEYIVGALEGVADCIIDGIPVLGYLHWTLIDNFEFNWGTKVQFGLVSMNKNTFERIPKPSAYFLGDIARRNELYPVK